MFFPYPCNAGFGVSLTFFALCVAKTLLAEMLAVSFLHAFVSHQVVFVSFTLLTPLTTIRLFAEALSIVSRTL